MPDKFVWSTVVWMPKVASKFAISLFVFGMMALMAFFIRLGYWQVQRAVEKERILNAASHAQTLAVKSMQTLPMPANPKAQFRWVTLSGEYEPYTVLLDNQQRDHHIGYDVLTPFRLAGGSQRILVDRGFIVRDVRRSSYPFVPAPKGLQKIQGYLYQPSDKQWVLGEVLQFQDKHTAVLERLDVAFISNVLQKSLYPAILRLSPAMAEGFRRDWPLVNMPPERHKAYALQWFSMAGLTLLICIVIVWRRKNGDEV